MSSQPSSTRKYSLIGDIYNGAVHGDFTELRGKQLGVAGYATQTLIALIPVIGTICAFRDFQACRKKKDTFGVIFNGLACIPFIGAFPKTAAVIHAGRGLRHTGSLAKEINTTLRGNTEERE
jgi:hypothetical protein